MRDSSHINHVELSTSIVVISRARLRGCHTYISFLNHMQHTIHPDENIYARRHVVREIKTLIKTDTVLFAAAAVGLILDDRAGPVTVCIINHPDRDSTIVADLSMSVTRRTPPYGNRDYSCNG